MEAKKLIENIKKLLPSDAMITDYAFEGANIVLYTKNKLFLFNHKTSIKKVVETIKKRVEVRPDTILLRDPESTKKEILEMVPKEAGIKDLWFDEKRSIVIIEADKPGIIIGKNGALLEKIRNNTIWIPKVRRAPVVKSDIIRTIRLTYYQNSDYRRKFLNELGKKIYVDWNRNEKYWVRISALGGFREVGRSCLLLQTPISKVLIDCGVNVANERNAFPHLEAPEFNIKDLDAVIITHAHLDHHGFLPYLFKYGYKGPVYCTEPTRDIMTLLELDYVDIAQKEAKKVLYDSRDIKEMVKHTVCFEYGEVNDITPDIRITFHNAGHILGSSMVHLNIGEGFHNFLVTSDFKFLDSKLLNKAETSFLRLETVMIESTYGSKDDVLKPRREAELDLINYVSKTINRGGKVLIPVLGVGRAQEVMLILEEAVRKKLLPEIPIFIDGMVWDIAAITTTYPEFLNKKIRNLIFQQDHNPFLNPIFKRVGSNKERKEVIEETGPCVILATSGMLVGGPSVEYLKALSDNAKNSLIFVAYQGQGSPGRDIQNGAKEIYLEHEGKKMLVPIKLEHHTIHALTGHSDRNELINFVKSLNPRPKRIIINHGESSKCLDIASTLHKIMKVETSAPRNLDALRIR